MADNYTQFAEEFTFPENAAKDFIAIIKSIRYEENTFPLNK